MKIAEEIEEFVNEYTVAKTNVDLGRGIILFEEDFNNFAEHHPLTPIFKANWDGRRFMFFEGQLITEEVDKGI